LAADFPNFPFFLQPVVKLHAKIQNKAAIKITGIHQEQPKLEEGLQGLPL